VAVSKKTEYKTPSKFLLGDVFVYLSGGKRCHFRIVDIKTGVDSGSTVKAEFLWSSDGVYFGHGPGYVEEFEFSYGWIDFRYEIKKTTPYGCCRKCFGELHWVTMALKCKVCGAIF